MPTLSPPLIAQGDPIETNALVKAVAPDAVATELPANFVFSMGAVKALTGHLEGSAGLAGLAHALVVLQQQAVVPLRYRNINPYVASGLDAWRVKSRCDWCWLLACCCCWQARGML